MRVHVRVLPGGKEKNKMCKTSHRVTKNNKDRRRKRRGEECSMEEEVEATNVVRRGW